PSQSHVDRLSKTARSEASRDCGRPRSRVWRRLCVVNRLLDAQPAYVPGSRAESGEGRLDANYSIVRRKAAQGNLGGFFHFGGESWNREAIAAPRQGSVYPSGKGDWP